RSWTTRPGCPAEAGSPRRPARVETVPTPASLSPVGQPLVVNTERRPRSRTQPLLGDRLSAALAGAVAPVVEPQQGAIDLRERLHRPLLEPLVELAVERDGRHVAEMVVAAAAGELAELVLHGAIVLVVEVRERVCDPTAFLREQRAELGTVDGCHPCSFPVPTVAELRRRSISSGPIPASATILSREPCPETISTSRRGTASVSASRRTRASFARPPSDGAATRIFQTPPRLPTTPPRRAPGATRRVSFVGPSTPEVYAYPSPPHSRPPETLRSCGSARADSSCC